MALAVDFDALRVALVAAVRQATGLGQNSVVMAETEQPISVRPDLPFATLKWSLLAQSAGRSWTVPADDDGLVTYRAPRSMSVGFDFYGRTHEEAYGLAATFDAALSCDEIHGPLFDAGLAILTTAPVVDLSALISTGYEGRAHVTVTFGYTTALTLTVGSIEHVPVQGSVLADNGAGFPVGFTANLNEDL